MNTYDVKQPTVEVSSSTKVMLGCFGIVLELNDEGGGTISSDLKESCPYCDCIECNADCDGSAGDIDGLEDQDDLDSRNRYNAAIDGLESLILAHAFAGIDITTPAYLEGIETAESAIGNNS
tara:strand:- start:3796 stop:4161 length:366 start_codon:yes stop_codon:yes gene_type:complete